ERPGQIQQGAQILRLRRKRSFEMGESHPEVLAPQRFASEAKRFAIAGPRHFDRSSQLLRLIRVHGSPSHEAVLEWISIRPKSTIPIDALVEAALASVRARKAPVSPTG